MPVILSALVHPAHTQPTPGCPFVPAPAHTWVPLSSCPSPHLGTPASCVSWSVYLVASWAPPDPSSISTDFFTFLRLPPLCPPKPLSSGHFMGSDTHCLSKSMTLNTVSSHTRGKWLSGETAAPCTAPPAGSRIHTLASDPWPPPPSCPCPQSLQKPALGHHTENSAGTEHLAR